MHLVFVFLCCFFLVLADVDALQWNPPGWLSVGVYCFQVHCGVLAEVSSEVSRFDSKTLLLDLIAHLIQKFVGLLSGSVCMHVKEHRILLCNLRCGGANDGSISSTIVAVVLNIPSIAFIAIHCAVLSLLTCPGRCV
jgi:hypothetical protein